MITRLSIGARRTFTRSQPAALALQKARQQGSLTQDWQRHLDELLGLREQSAPQTIHQPEPLTSERNAQGRSEIAAADEALHRYLSSETFSLRQQDQSGVADLFKAAVLPGDSRAWAELPFPQKDRQQVQNLTGVDLSGYRRVVDASAMRHVIKKHGENSKDPYPITERDIENLPRIADAPGASGLAQSRNKSVASILSVKYFEGWYYYAEEVRTGAKALALVSLRKSPASKPAQADTAEASPYTPEAVLREADARLQRALEDYKLKSNSQSSQKSQAPAGSVEPSADNSGTPPGQQFLSNVIAGYHGPQNLPAQAANDPSVSERQHRDIVDRKPFLKPVVDAMRTMPPGKQAAVLKSVESAHIPEIPSELRHQIEVDSSTCEIAMKSKMERVRPEWEAYKAEFTPAIQNEFASKLESIAGDVHAYAVARVPLKGDRGMEKIIAWADRFGQKPDVSIVTDVLRASLVGSDTVQVKKC